ncbi:cholesterol esterase [Glycomyces fuscus]|nr:cholesterol esterase [Glycomyces fuscus]
MDTTSPDTPESHTSWKRFALFSLPAGAAVGGILIAMAQGALAASFTVSGQDFKISADELDGEGFVQYGWLDQTVREEAVPVAVAGIREAEIQGLCQSVLTEFPIVGQISLRLTAGDQGTPVIAENLVIDMSQMDGNASFENIEIGRDAGTLDQGPQGARGFNDLFGMQSDTIVIEDLEQTARAASAGTFRLSGLSMGISMGDDECF